MGRMQVPELGLVLVFSWAASSSGLHVRKMEGRWYHIFAVSNDLDWLSDYHHLRLYSPYFTCIGHNCDAILLRFQFRYMGYCNHLYPVQKKQHGGLYPIMVPPAKILEVLDVGDSTLLQGSEYRSLSRNTYAVLALGRERRLSEGDMEKFQKVLQDNGIVAEPVHFMRTDICIVVYFSEK